MRRARGAGRGRDVNEETTSRVTTHNDTPHQDFKIFYCQNKLFLAKKGKARGCRDEQSRIVDEPWRRSSRMRLRSSSPGPQIALKGDNYNIQHQYEDVEFSSEVDGIPLTHSVARGLRLKD